MEPDRPGPFDNIIEYLNKPPAGAHTGNIVQSNANTGLPGMQSQPGAIREPGTAIHQLRNFQPHAANIAHDPIAGPELPQ